MQTLGASLEAARGPRRCLGQSDASVGQNKPLDQWSRPQRAVIDRKRWSRPRLRAAFPRPGGDEGSHGRGDKKVQDILVDMVRLQSDRMRVTEFVEEKSRHLSSIADEARAEYEKIQEEVLRGMDEAGSKVLNKVNADAEAFEEELARARQEQESRDEAFDAFEKRVEEARSEGLFFKSLYRSTKVKALLQAEETKQAIWQESQAVAKTSERAAGTKGRRLLYIGLAVMASLTLVEVVTREPVEWSKVVVYGAIVVALLAQLTYEKLLSQQEGKDE